MTKRPSYQWYPGDFKRDTALQACSFEARSLWREMLDLMHDGEPYGYLTAGGVPIQDAQLARMVGIAPRKCTAWLFELQERGVFSRTEQGVIYSRRMVRDGQAHDEWLDKSSRGGRASAAKRATKDQPPHQPNGNQPPNQDPNQRATLQSASASAVKTKTTTSAPKQPARESWLLPASRIWEGKFGEGSFPWAKFGRHAKPLRDHHPPAMIADRLMRYLKRTDVRFVSIPRFVETFAQYAPVDAGAILDEFGCLTPFGENEIKQTGTRVA